MGAVFSAAVMLVAYNFFDSPKEKQLRREVEQYKLEYEILNSRLDNIQAVLKDVENRDDNIYRVIFEAEPIPNEVRNAGIGGRMAITDATSLLETARRKSFTSEALSRLSIRSND